MDKEKENGRKYYMYEDQEVENIKIRVKNIQKKMKDSNISLLEISKLLDFPVEQVSDTLFFRKSFKYEILIKMEMYKFDVEKYTPYDDLGTLGSRIKFIRINVLRMSEVEFGKALSPKHSRQFISEVEACKIIPSLGLLIDISNLSGVSLDWLLKNKGY